MKPLVSMCLGYAAAGLHIGFDVVGAASVQLLRGTIPDIQLCALRLCLQTSVVGIIGKWHGSLHKLSTTDLRWMGVAVLGYVGCNAGFYGSAKCMPLADHGSFGYLVTMITLAGLQQCLQRESPGKINMLAMFIGSVGIVMTTQPSFIFHTNMVNVNQSFCCDLTNISVNLSKLGPADTLSAGLYCYLELFIGSAGIGIFFFVFEHQLAHLSTTTQLFWMSLGALLLSIPLSIYTESINVKFIFDKSQVLLLLGHCFGAGTALCLNNIGIQLIGALRFTIVISLTVVVELVVENKLLDNYQPGHGNVLEVVGILTVTVSIMLPGMLALYKAKYMGPSHSFSDF